MKEKRFKIGQRVTPINSKGLVSVFGRKNEYHYGGSTLISKKIKDYYGFVESKGCYQVMMKNGWKMLESEFEEYFETKKEEQYEVY